MSNHLIAKAEQYIADNINTVNKRWYPKYHLAPPIGWTNDPNGLVWFNGYYHAFYQHYPYGAYWGPMHWGHARSKDLIHWEHLPIALAPSSPEDKDGCFSGSAIVEKDTLYLIYTGNKFDGEQIDDNLYQVQCLATSKDGIHFEKQGIIIDTPKGLHHFRDPKIWKDKETWFMVVGARVGDEGEVQLYQSDDLYHWQYLGVLAKSNDEMGFMWECPDFFKLGDKYVLMMSPQGIKAAGYKNRNLSQAGCIVGSWSPNHSFTYQTPFEELDLGMDFYAPQSFLTPDGRRVIISWLDMWESAMPEKKDNWAGMLSLPRELTLSSNNQVQMQPIKELLTLRDNFTPFETKIEKNTVCEVIKSCDIGEIILNIDCEKNEAERYGIRLGNGINLYVDNQAQRLVLERSYPQYSLFGVRSVALPCCNMLNLRIFIDMSSIEIFINEGYACLSSRIYPEPNERSVSFYAESGSAELSNDSGFWSFNI